MKKILLLIIVALFCNLAKSQITPYYLIQDKDTLGVVLSIKQLQRLDNNAELLKLFKQLDIDCDNLDKNYNLVINEYNKRINLLDLNVSTLEKQGKEKDNLIENQKKQIKIYTSDSLLTAIKIANKDAKIGSLEQEVRKEKNRKWFSIGLNIVQTFAIFYLITKL